MSTRPLAVLGTNGTFHKRTFYHVRKPRCLPRARLSFYQSVSLPVKRAKVLLTGFTHRTTHLSSKVVEKVNGDQ